MTLAERCVEHLRAAGWQTPTMVAAAIGHARNPVDAQLRRQWRLGVLERRDALGDGRKVEYRVRGQAPVGCGRAGPTYARNYRWEGE